MSLGDLQNRIFGSQIGLPPVGDVPGHDLASTTAIRDVAQGDPPGTALGNSGLVPKGLTQADMAKAEVLVRKMASLMANANITASLPAFNQPNFWTKPIDLSGRIVLPPTVGPYQTVLAFTCPEGTRTRISGFGVTAAATQGPPTGQGYAYDGSILWQILVNGIQVPFLADWGEQRGSLTNPRETFIILQPGDSIFFQARRAAISNTYNIAWLPLTPYVIGDFVTNGINVYICTSNGTSAAGPGPAGFGSGIVDGTTTWDYVSSVGGDLGVNMALTGWFWKPRRDYEGSRAGVN